LIMFDAFRFKVAATFFVRFVDPSDLCEVGMMLVLFFCFCWIFD
jgi:hypothetical protein